MDESNGMRKKTRYCIRMWLLQEVAGCSFVEARIYLRRERNETPEKLMEIYSLDADTYAEIESSADRKVSDAESKGDIFRGYGPLYNQRNETVDW